MAIKAHKTVTVTRRMLERSGACEDGLNEVADLLPAVISTDPEDNLELAIAAERLRPNPCACGMGAVTFLPGVLDNTYPVDKPDRDIVSMDAMGYSPHDHVNYSDPWVLAQQLAGWADSYLVARGR